MQIEEDKKENEDEEWEDFPIFDEFDEEDKPEFDFDSRDHPKNTNNIIAKT